MYPLCVWYSPPERVITVKTTKSKKKEQARKGRIITIRKTLTREVKSNHRKPSDV